ncbi:hypothetical protein ACFV4X_12705 [Streptomyces ardesiacus]|uniref:hypothetical protein n=1 Tax=Streptomyces ardesiacus TaxID=285564 RepID=UPI0036515B39
MALYDNLGGTRLRRKPPHGSAIPSLIAGGAPLLPPHCDRASDQTLTRSFT